ncbi:Phox homologous domain-containing protein [Umbelopsis sp. PMI_123]|nr:Phox homologous domain-containing protein [Umbelopsis sp. PMI_123]
MAEIIQAIYVRNAENRDKPKPHTVYRIEIHAAVRSWSIWKRYSEFEKFHNQLLAQFPKHPPPNALPPKHWFSNTYGNADKIEERRRGLDAYLRGIMSSRDDRWRQTDVWREFLSIPTGRPLDASAMYTSESWLDEFREMQTSAREVRSLVNKRETHIARNEISASHNCTMQAKKLLTVLSSRISDLDAGLMGLANGSSGESLMTEGELRRRQDLLSGLKDERDTLVRLVSAARSDVMMQSDAKPAKAGDRRALLKSPTNVDNQDSFGFPQAAAAQQTEQTRGVDNEGLLKLQQQMMDDQDSQVEQFSAILNRQRQVGYAIGQELENQNQLLEELDSDLDRTQVKLKFANKKLNKIK